MNTESIECPEELPVELANHIVQLHLKPETYWRISLVNKACHRFAKERVRTLFKNIFSDIPYDKDNTIIMGPIAIRITNAMDGIERVTEIRMSFPNGELVWEKYSFEEFYLAAFYYRSQDLNHVFLNGMFGVLRYIFGLEHSFEYPSTHRYCECNQCIEQNTYGNCDVYPTPQILLLKPINSTIPDDNPNLYLVLYKTNLTNRACVISDGVGSGTVIYNPKTNEWGCIIQSDGKPLPTYFGQPTFYGNYQAVMNAKAMEWKNNQM
jgi:hypothetical protein